MKHFISFILGLLFIPNILFATTHYSVDLGYRSAPSGFNGVGTMAYDGILWGEAGPKNPFYGYYRVGARLGGSPTAAAFLQVAPMSPIIFEVQKGTTQRFLDIKSFNCDTYECKGRVDRTDYTLRLIGAYKNFIALGSAMWREIRTEDKNNNKAVALELEYFSITPGFHRFFETSLLMGYQLENKHIIGLSLTDGVISEGDRRYNSIYGVYRWSWNEYSISAGAGEYNSQTIPHEFGVLLLVSAKWGERLSLF